VFDRGENNNQPENDFFLNDTVELHVKAVHHHQNLVCTEIRQPQVNVAGIWRWNPVSPDSGDQTDLIPATWPKSSQNS
jgi:hypothetical protein